jgi:2-polyprenyl-6-methoxyphenol hydroxylase-like FAD-dependent oxidoreductase
MTENDCDVLVVGADPQGFMAANLLKRGRISIRIVDQGAHGFRESRAFAIVARSVELFGQLGLADKILNTRCSYAWHRLFCCRRVGWLNYVWAGSLATHYPIFTLHPQSDREAVLTEDLAKLGIEVEWQATVNIRARSDME